MAKWLKGNMKQQVWGDNEGGDA